MLDGLIRAIAPSWALSRAQARLAETRLTQISARYEGARVSRRTRGWNAPNTSPNVETKDDLKMLRARSRDLVRNNPYASAGLKALVGYQVGTGIVPQSRTGDAALDRQANALWAEWGATADAGLRHDIYGLQSLAARTRSEAGEVLILLRPLSVPEAARRGSRVPLALHVMEPDHLDGAITNGMPAPLNDGFVQGVKLDGFGAAEAYRIWPQHPGDQFVQLESALVPSRYILHVYRQARPGQVRGVPDLAPVITRLRLLDEYEDAVFMQQLSQSIVAAFVTSSAEMGEGPLEDASGVKSLSPGMIERLHPGENVEFLTPSGHGPFAEFARHQLRAVATGFGLTYDLLTGDLTQANYSSLRAGRLAFKRQLEQDQWLMMVPQMCAPLWRAFVDAAQTAGLLPRRAGEWPVEWAPPRFEMVDPLKDTMAIKEQLRLGLLTWGQAVAEMGWDPEKQAAEIAEWNAKHDDAGLVFDGDARRVAQGGAAHDAKQLAAIEIGATGAALPAPATGETTDAG
jgi:lambda family phage portal protein